MDDPHVKGGVLLKGTDHESKVSVHGLDDASSNNDDPEAGVEMADHAVHASDADVGGPQGRWRHGLCGWTESGCTNLCCMSCICPVIVISQVMTRLGLDWCGNPSPATAAGTFSVVILVYFGFWVSYLMLFGLFLLPCMVFWILTIFTRTRYETRRYFQIPARYCDCCHGAAEDCLVTTFCQCCATLQMARHTHDEDRYPYHFNMPTGLPPDAPPLYDDITPELQFDSME